VDINWDDYNAGRLVLAIAWAEMEQAAIDGTLDDARLNEIQAKMSAGLRPLTLPLHFADGMRTAIMLMRSPEMVEDLAERTRARGVGTPELEDFREIVKRMH
jgi:small neutral amino acid transporter SnatA (MarC family)